MDEFYSGTGAESIPALRREASMDQARPTASSVKRGLDDFGRFPALGAGGRDQFRGQARAWGIFRDRIRASRSAGRAGTMVLDVVTGFIGCPPPGSS
jgi:hypothetical protein